MTGAFSLLELLAARRCLSRSRWILVSIAGSLSSFRQVEFLTTSGAPRRSPPFRAWRGIFASRRHRSIRTQQISASFNPTNGARFNYLLPQAAFWQAPVASDRSRGNMALVGYFVQWVNEGERIDSKPAGSWSITIFNLGSLRTGFNDALIASKRRRTRPRPTMVSWPRISSASGCSRSIRQKSRSWPMPAMSTHAVGRFDSTQGYRAGRRMPPHAGDEYVRFGPAGEHGGRRGRHRRPARHGG